MALNPPSGRPSWPALLGLTLLVLVIHLWLIVGEPPRWTQGVGTGASPDSDPANTVLPSPGPTGGDVAVAAMARAQPVDVSTVRWILPQAAPAPAVTPSAPRPTRIQPTPPPRPAEPATDALAPAPEPPPAAAQAQAEVVPPPPAPDASPPATAPTPEEMAPPEAQLAATSQKTTTAASAPPGSSGIPASPAPSMTLSYDLQGKAKGLSYSADAELRWHNDGARYTARMEISAFLLGNRVQTSEGQVGPGGLLPERFGDKRRSSEKAAHFDPAGRRIRFSNNAPDATWLPGAQDRLSLFLQLGALLQARPEAYPPGSTIELQVAGTGSADIWRFEVGQVESLSLPAGTVSALRLVRSPRQEHDITVEIWLAPAHRFLPARIRITDADGSQADQQLRQLPPQVLQ